MEKGMRLLEEPTPETDPYFYGWRYVTRIENGKKITEQVPLTKADILHPQEGDFIVLNRAHTLLCDYLKAVFEWRLANHAGALVMGDHRIDWQTGGVKPHGPDVVVLFDSPEWNPFRGTYPVRDQGARPVLVIEVTSPSTRDTDLNEKVTQYNLAQIPLYVIIDQREGEIGPVIDLLAYRYSPSGPAPVTLADPDRIWLEDLNLWLAIDGDRVICQEPDGTPVKGFVEVTQFAKEAEELAKADRARADEASALAIAERARAEAEKSRADEASALAIAERARADEASALAIAERARAEAEATARVEAERAQVESERARADINERRIAELEAELRRLRGS